MASPEELFTQAFNGITSRFSVVQSLRRVANLGMPLATPKVHEEWLVFAHQLFHDPQYEHMFLDKKQALQASGGIEGMGKTMAENQLSMFKAAVDAASLVFAHSIVDSAALDYLRVTAAHNHSDWIPFVEQKKISVSTLKGRTYDEIVKDTVAEYLDLLDRQSLLTKVDRLFQICKPEPHFEPMNDYKFDRDRLEKLDRLRHDIVHGSGPVTALEDGDDDVWFLQKTAFYFMGLVNMRYDTRIDPKLLVQPKIG